jgi:hypothetical protein
MSWVVSRFCRFYESVKEGTRLFSPVDGFCMWFIIIATYIQRDTLRELFTPDIIHLDRRTKFGSLADVGSSPSDAV